jgi:transposase
VKENVRDIYTFYGDPAGAAFWIDSLILGCKQSVTKEVKAVGRMLKQWREPILAWHTTGASNGPVEGFNQVIKKVKRIAAGFRKFEHYRTRILLATGGCNWALIGA